MRNKELMKKLNPYQEQIRSERKKKIVKDKKKNAQYKTNSNDFKKMIEEKITTRISDD